MAQAVFGVISAVAGICKIIQFGQEQAAAQDDDNSVIKVQIGLDYGTGLSNAGGALPDVRLFNEAGEFIGMEVDPGDVGDGEQGEITVDQDDGSQATYALFTANDDAICIAYTSITWPDSSKYAWTGDWGKQCGATWYYSHVYIKNQNYKPACMWIDADGDQPQTGFSVHYPEFVSKSNNVPADKDVDYFCNNSPVFGIHEEEDPNSIDYWPLGGGGNRTTRRSAPAAPLAKRHTARLATPRSVVTTNKAAQKANKAKRSGQGRVSAHLNKLVVGKDAVNHPTAPLCESATSAGPDFVNRDEGLFCHMETKTLYPVCDEVNTDRCFDLDSQSLVVGGKATREEPYEKVFDWTVDE